MSTSNSLTTPPHLVKGAVPRQSTLRQGTRATPWALRPLLDGRDLVLFLQHSKTEAVTRAYVHTHICTYVFFRYYPLMDYYVIVNIVPYAIW